MEDSRLANSGKDIRNILAYTNKRKTDKGRSHLLHMILFKDE